MIKKYAQQFVLIAGIGLSLFSGLSQTADVKKSSKLSEDATIKLENLPPEMQYLKDRPEVFESLLELMTCVDANISEDNNVSEDGTVEMPSVCKEALRKFKMTVPQLPAEMQRPMIADAEQLPTMIQHCKNEENFQKLKGELIESFKAHVSSSTTEMPSACKEPLRNFRTVATPEQLPALVQELEEHVSGGTCEIPAICEALRNFKMVATLAEVNEFIRDYKEGLPKVQIQ